ncbi:hypothetical protein OJF2_75090 [Aquisphaera giovannonii]|uniref:Uncharacterized protein n=1 Tax=Aquisphaera giovannonii TaxID=406548 RepID=A0A5B9WF65_9BACT|nr:hypothetical protein [Aquisphaera giovannonii]QEH38899.1 hypothetical protein OJF2_75090 [Aquisphaera giovannonii]
MDQDKERLRLVEQAHAYLESAGNPRLVMLGVLSMSLAAGFLASIAMVHLGVLRMPIRYPIAVAAAYATFLGMLRSWLRKQSLAADLSDDPEGLLAPGAAAFGAAATLAKAGEPEPGRPEEKKKSNPFGGGDLSGLGDLGGEGCGLLVVLVLIAGLCTLLVSCYLIVTSPMLLAELLVDGLLLGAMSRAVIADRPPHWSRSVLRRTWLPALITAVVFGLVGWGIERVAPGANTLAQAWAIDQRR